MQGLFMEYLSLEGRKMEFVDLVNSEKKLKESHKVLQQVTTTKVIELLHMDFMGPMQVEST